MQEVVPACLTAACPALRMLRLDFCIVRAPEDVQQQQLGEVAAAFPSQLQSLCWRYGSIVPLQHVLATALAALPSLSSLDVRLQDGGSSSSDDVCTVLSALTGQQLTHLKWVHGWREEPSVPSFLTSCATTCKLSKLQGLDISGTTLDDAGLHALLANFAYAHTRPRARVCVAI
jgi:hypothetical protein